MDASGRPSAGDLGEAAGDLPIGFLGLGDIGLPMAQRLLDTGQPLVVYNRTAHRSAELCGAVTVAATPAEVAEAVSVLVTCLHGPDADRDVYLGRAGLTTVDLTGTLVVNTATIGPNLAQELDAAVRGRGGRYLDAPLLGGGRVTAAAGELLIPVGGELEAVAIAEPVLARLATRWVAVGPVGAAQRFKLVNNLLVAVGAAALAQAVGLARAGGLDPALLVDILPAASSQSRVMDMYLAEMVAGPTDRRGTLRTLAKDIALAVEWADSVGADATLGGSASDMFAAALAAGLGPCSVPALASVAATGSRRET